MSSLTPAKQFVAKVVASLGTGLSEQSFLPYVVVAPSSGALNVARREITASLAFFGLTVQWLPSRHCMVIDGAEIVFYAGHDWRRFLGYCIRGYWVIAPGQCSSKIVDECRYAASAIGGWSIMSADAA